MLTHAERILSARRVIENLLRARKAIRIYPDTNPVTKKYIDDLYSELLKLLAFQDKIAFDVSVDEIHFELEEIFHSASQENNIPLLLFRDGVREVIFRKGLTRDEVARFAAIIAGEVEGGGDDLVTSIWDQDFDHIRCIIYEPDMFDLAGDAGFSGVDGAIGPELSSELQRAHKDAVSKMADEQPSYSSMEFSDAELMTLKREIELNKVDKTGKLLAIILELFLLAETDNECNEIENIMKKAVELALDARKIDVLADFFINVKKAYMDAADDPRFKANLSRVFSFFNSERFLIKVGAMLDGGVRLSDETRGQLIRLLDKGSIRTLISILGYLETISARKAIVNILGEVGKNDIDEVTRGLADSRWYVVRNIVIALRKTGDRQAKQELLAIIGHKDARVRREVVKALAELGGDELKGVLKTALEDPDLSVRWSALSSIPSLGESSARAFLKNAVRSSRFLNLDYEEKKEYYNTLLRYNSEDVRYLLEQLLRKRSLFGKARNDENKSALAYSIGVKREKSFLPCLLKLVDSKNEMLKKTVDEAIRKIEHGS
ncbi:MAG TPA: HEAT repeat domain-containing protein [Dissulfurispiraceae bacterium]|nr:HEAT repeat domain-containing protein [Dissulfurispiraceae bacterium]